MDTLFIGDIPKEYHYAIFNNGYIDLYNTQNLHNNTYTRYRIYTNVGGFYYDVSQVTYGNYSTISATDVKCSSDFVYRTDFSSIVLVTFIFAIFGVWLLNILTSLVRKGGVLGGLL